MTAKGKLRIIRAVYVVSMICMVALTVDVFMNWGTLRTDLSGISLSMFFGTLAYFYLKGKYQKELAS